MNALLNLIMLGHVFYLELKILGKLCDQIEKKIRFHLSIVIGTSQNVSV